MATPAEILSEAECVVCAGNASMFEVFAIQILKNITGMTQAEIEAESSCFICYGMSQSQAAMLVLLNNLSGGGSGTGGAGSVGAGSPEGVVVAPPGTSYYDTVGLTFWYKLTGVGAVGWVQVV